MTYLAILELIEYENLNNQEAYSKFFEKLKEAYRNSEENNEFFLCLINLANMYLLSKNISKAELICQKMNNLLEYGEMKFSSKELKNIKENKDKDKFRKNIDEIKSIIFCLNAKIYHFKKNINEAYSWYSKSLNCNPKNLEAAFGLGQIHVEMSNFLEAQKCFELCKSMKNYNIEVEKNLAFIYAKNKKKQEDAIEMYKTAIGFKKDNLDCYLELAQLLEFRAPEECLKLYEIVLEQIRSGNFKNTENDFYIIRQNMPEILNNCAVVKLRMNNLQGVDSLLYEALQIVKKKTDEFLAHANQKAENNTLKQNENQEHRAVPPKYKSLELSIYFNLALYFEAKNEFAEAYKYYKHIIKENPYFVDAYIKLGELAKLRGHEKKAIDYMKLALDKHFKKDAKADANPNARLLTMLPKPINPILNLAQIFFDSGNEQDAISYLKTILNEYDDKDIYTIIFLGNVHYEQAVNFRKGPTKDRDYNLRKSLEYYYRALELDKFNCYASIGIANILSEFNLTSFALDTYKKVSEKMPNNPNPLINEGILYMNENKYEHAIMTFNKILKKFFKNKYPELELLIAKNYISNKEFEKGLKILKCLMFRYPDNISYKFNYALCLRAKSEDILQKPERKVKETEEAILNLEKSIPIFESIKNLKKEIFSNFHSVYLLLIFRLKRKSISKTLISLLHVKIFPNSLKNLLSLPSLT
jgi:tetratricopeptide (TPR) repeat protein